MVKSVGFSYVDVMEMYFIDMVEFLKRAVEFDKENNKPRV